MGLKVDDPRAPYLQVADDLRRSISSGALGSGDKLPSTRELMEQYQVANMTIQNALRVLRDEGLIYGVPGRGSFVRHRLTRADPEREGGAHTPEYEAMARQLDALSDELRRLAERVSQLEEQARPAPRRQRARRSDGTGARTHE
jgi:DNA-binding GntR family transcriptional regulator